MVPYVAAELYARGRQPGRIRTDRCRPRFRSAVAAGRAEETRVASLAVWAWVESLERTLGHWGCVSLHSDDTGGNVWPFRM